MYALQRWKELGYQHWFYLEFHFSAGPNLREADYKIFLTEYFGSISRKYAKSLNGDSNQSLSSFHRHPCPVSASVSSIGFCAHSRQRRLSVQCPHGPIGPPSFSAVTFTASISFSIVRGVCLPEGISQVMEVRDVHGWWFISDEYPLTFLSAIHTDKSINRYILKYRFPDW